MRTMLLTGVAVMAVAGSTLVYAQQRPERSDDGRRGAMSADDRDAFRDARIAALHAGLRLSADQEKNWADFERAYRDFAALRAQRSSQPQPAPANSPIDRMARRADALTQHGEAMKRLANAASPLYGSLDDAQKRRFAMLSRLGPGMHGQMRTHGMERFGMDRRDMDSPDLDNRGMDRRGMNRPDMERPDMDRSDMDRPGRDRPDMGGPGGMSPRRGAAPSDGDMRDRFGMMEPRGRNFGRDMEQPSARERFERWRERSFGPPRSRGGVDGAEQL